MVRPPAQGPRRRTERNPVRHPVEPARAHARQLQLQRQPRRRGFHRDGSGLKHCLG